MAGKKVKLSNINLQAGTTNTYYVTWTFAKKYAKNTANYKVVWQYATGNGVWFYGNGDNGSTTTTKQSTYSPPSNAKKIRVKVKPVAKTEKKDKKTTPKYSGAAWCSWKGKTLDGSSYIEEPNAPSVSVSYTALTATVDYDNDERKVTAIKFEVVEDNTKKYFTGEAALQHGTATIVITVNPGHNYKVRAAARYGNAYSDWSDFSSAVATMPGDISGKIEARATSETEVFLDWNDAVNAHHYEIEYTKNKSYFNISSSEVQSDTTTGHDTVWYISNLETGKTWYFRVRGVGSDGTPGHWSFAIASVTLGTKPNPPTTWTYTYTAIVGDSVILHWAHNSADGSAQTAANLEVKSNGSTIINRTWNNATSSFTLDTSNYADGTELYWRVRTKGILNTYSEWSAQRKLTIRQRPTIGVSIESTVSRYPFAPTIYAGPSSQSAISISISVIANDSYDTFDEFGVGQHIAAGQEIFSKYYDSPGSNTINPVLTPGDIDLENNISYTLKASAAMDSGLSAEGSVDFTVAFDDESFLPDAEITTDADVLACYIRPFCETNPDDDDEESEPVTNVTFNVYRRQYDGSFVTIAKGLDGSGSTTVTDPHPSLDLPRYRIVAVSNATGAISYTDAAGLPFNVGYMVIQWDEAWMEFDYAPDQTAAEPPWSGSMLKLPYNIDISADHSPDVELVEYIGRENPVSYYGTQRGETGRWSVEIPKNDQETLYQIRRLATYKGDCYVREPSGLGYWANIAVSYSLTHNKMTVPVNFTVNRVEGDI